MENKQISAIVLIVAIVVVGAMFIASQAFTGKAVDTNVKSKGGVSDSSAANGKISVRVKATNLDTENVYYFDPSEEGTSPDGGPKGVTYCSRSQKLEASFAGLNCKADLYTGVVTCEDPE